MTVVADREPEATPKERRVWLLLGAVLVLGLTAFAVTRPSEFCPSDLRNVVDDDYQPTSEVVCESPIIGVWQLYVLRDAVSLSALPDPDLWAGGSGGTVQFFPEGSLSGNFCNSFATHFQVSETTLRTSEVVSTLRGCSAMQERVEGLIVSALRYAEATYEVKTVEVSNWPLATVASFPPGTVESLGTHTTLTITSGDTTLVFQPVNY